MEPAVHTHLSVELRRMIEHRHDAAEFYSALDTDNPDRTRTDTPIGRGLSCPFVRMDSCPVLTGQLSGHDSSLCFMPITSCPSICWNRTSVPRSSILSMVLRSVSGLLSGNSALRTSPD